MNIFMSWTFLTFLTSHNALNDDEGFYPEPYHMDSNTVSAAVPIPLYIVLIDHLELFV